MKKTKKLLPHSLFLIQPLMKWVCYSLLPCLAAATYFFGLRALALTAVVVLAGVVTEGLFTLRQGKPITSAVFVSALIFSLSLPPTLPFWMAVVGIVFGITFGKMVFGGFGYNVFNPAMVGRCFIYITFPVAMTNRWVQPLSRSHDDLLTWFPAIDAVSAATPLSSLSSGVSVPLRNLFMGSTAGSLGETCAPIIILGGIYILIKKAAPWRLAIACLIGGISMSIVLYTIGLAGAVPPLAALLSGSFLFGTFFVVTEPISGPKQKLSQWIYGGSIGALTILLRRYSNFPEGIMFAVLFMNMFAPLFDIGVTGWKHRGEAK